MSLWLWVGVACGYCLLMATSPVRTSLADGVRALRRYPALWFILGLCGFGYAAFHLIVRAHLAYGPPGVQEVAFRWSRGPILWQWRSLFGTPESLWYLPPRAAVEASREAFSAALESTAGLFNNLVSTFPLAVLASLLLWLNWQGHQGVLFRALRRRFGVIGWFLHGAILLCATATLAKSALYFYVPAVSPVVLSVGSAAVAWLSFLFEYGVGVGVQIYLILLAYCWFRGLTFTPQHLVDVAIRRFSYVIRWALVVMFLSSVFIDLPIALRHLELVAEHVPTLSHDPEQVIPVFRSLLSGVFLLFATVQITLTFHSESLGRAFIDHFRFVGQHWWAVLWLMIISALHFYALHLANGLIQRAVGERTALAIAWELLFPWLLALLGAWLLTSWVGIYRRAEQSRSQDAALTPKQMELGL